jgi:hypothetical protein
MSARIGLWIAIVASVVSCQKRDPLFCGENPTDPRCALDDGGVTDVAAGYVTIGGNVNGLTGAGLVLQNNGGDDKLIGSDGKFGFATAIPMDTAYDVTVSTQPTNPSQNCTVTNGTGTAADNVSDVQVNCTTATYTVGGTVIGCTGTCMNNLVLTDNGGDDLTIPASGAFVFHTPVASQSAYSVAIKTNPNGNCRVAGGTGMVGNANISTVVVNCTPNTYTLGGMAPDGGVTGLNGAVTLHAVYGGPSPPAPDTIAVSTDSFAFPSALQLNQTWAITVTGQPAYPPAAQDCAVTALATGTISSNVTSVAVACTTKQFMIGGMVSGLNGGTVVLRDNGGDDLTITANAPFTFATPITSGFTYAATVYTQPVGQFCSVTMGSGTVTNGDITTIAVTCADPGIKCGNKYCNGAQKCCDPEGFNPKCVGTGQQCFALSLPCDDAFDCGSGKKCCASLHNGNGYVTSVSCSTTCGGGTAQMCDPGVTGECASGTCSAWSKLSGYDACQ